MQLSRPHGRFHVKTILKTLIAIACLILVIARVQSIPSIRQFLFDEEVQYGFPTLRDVTYQPKISLIGVWTGNEQPNYLTWFLESIARQPDEVELVVVQRGRNLGNFGGDVVARAKNIKVVKMSDDRCKYDGLSSLRLKGILSPVRTDWDLHREYLCRRWGCNERDRRRIDRHLRDLGRYDPVSNLC